MYTHILSLVFDTLFTALGLVTNCIGLLQWCFWFCYFVYCSQLLRGWGVVGQTMRYFSHVWPLIKLPLYWLDLITGRRHNKARDCLQVTLKDRYEVILGLYLDLTASSGEYFYAYHCVYSTFVHH